MSYFYTVNTHGDYAAPAALGFNLIDVSSKSAADSLPGGAQGLVWVGNGTSVLDASAKAKYDSMASDPKVWGYFLADEPAATVTNGAANLRQHSNYIHQISNGRQKTMICLDDKPGQYAAYKPNITLVDWIALDPYPKNVNSFNPTHIDDRVNAALAAGIPRSQIAPVLQTFGQENLPNPYYAMPSSAEFNTILAHWDALVPNPGLTYCYSWGNQSSSNPTLVNSPGLQAILKARFAGNVVVPPPVVPPTAPPTFEDGKKAAYAEMKAFIASKGY